MSTLRISSLQDLVSAINVVLTLVGIVFVVVQLWRIKASLVSASHASIYERAADFRSHLIRHPELRPYFFDNFPTPEGHADLSRLTTLAELYASYLEHIFLTYEGLGGENRASLDRFLQGAVAASPIVRSLLDRDSFTVSSRFRDHIRRLGHA